jgi:ketosteroid isomerase-like protein
MKREVLVKRLLLALMAVLLVGPAPSSAQMSKAAAGYTTGTKTFTFPDAQGRPTTSNGRYVTVWRRARDGRWRCVVDFWNEAPPPA